MQKEGAVRLGAVKQKGPAVGHLDGSVSLASDFGSGCKLGVLGSSLPWGSWLSGETA